ncbi:MAG: cobalamin-binding protein [Candidatus Omnitrophica bacterium]|nr:cobalamin-binding protein [Candidatus Omnitrophota bacterium]
MIRKHFISILLSFALLQASVCVEVLADSKSRPRYVSLAPSVTEILFALGLGDEVVGVSSYCDYPQEAQDKEKVGDFSRPSVEKIVSLRPDYIFSTGLEQAPIVEQLRQLNLKVFVSDPSSLKELYDSIIDIGKITQKDAEAQVLLSTMQKQIQSVSQMVKDVPLGQRPKVFIEIWYDPLTTAGRGSFIDELVRVAGGINIASDTKRPYSSFSVEEVIRRDPDYIILAYMAQKNPQNLFAERFGWSEVTAVKNNQVYNDINPNILLRPGPRVVLGINEIHKRLYQ